MYAVIDIGSNTIRMVLYKVVNGELRQMLAWKAEERPYADWLRAFCDRKYDSGFSREMTRSVEEYLRDFEEEES